MAEGLGEDHRSHHLTRRWIIKSFSCLKRRRAIAYQTAPAVEIHFEDRSTGSPLAILQTVKVSDPVSHDQGAVRRRPSKARDRAIESEGSEPCTGLEVPHRHRPIVGARDDARQIRCQSLMPPWDTTENSKTTELTLDLGPTVRYYIAR